MKKIKNKLKNIFYKIRRFFMPTLQDKILNKDFSPISRKFGFDLGTPIDRVYTDVFLQKNSHYIQGVVCEIAENTYTLKFGRNITKSEILHIDKNQKNATIIADLTKHETLPENHLDCFIATVTLNFIYDYKKAIQGIYKMLRGGGLP